MILNQHYKFYIASCDKDGGIYTCEYKNGKAVILEKTAMDRPMYMTADSGVTVNSVAPGVIYTDRNIEALSDKGYAEQTKGKIPMNYWGEPEDCAGVISFLCRDEARYITGQNIFVDGGMGIK